MRSADAEAARCDLGVLSDRACAVPYVCDVPSPDAGPPAALLQLQVREEKRGEEKRRKSLAPAVLSLSLSLSLSLKLNPFVDKR